LLDAATKEVGRVLKDNLLQKFYETPQYKQINAMLYSPPASDDGRPGQAYLTKAWPSFDAAVIKNRFVFSVSKERVLSANEQATGPRAGER